MPRPLRPTPLLAPAPRRTRGWTPERAYRTADAESAPLSWDAARLLASLRRLSAVEDLDGLEGLPPARIATYRALPDPNHPFVKFQIVEADPLLLAFAGKPAPGFEVLEVCRAGFQFHWRQDLVRAFDEQLPLVGRLCGVSGRRELVVEHLLLPIVRKGRVREVRGWLVFGEDLSSGDAARLDDISMFRRIGRARPMRLPAALTRPGSESAKVQGLLKGLRDRWGTGAAREDGPARPQR